MINEAFVRSSWLKRSVHSGSMARSHRDSWLLHPQKATERVGNLSLGMDSEQTLFLEIFSAWWFSCRRCSKHILDSTTAAIINDIQIYSLILDFRMAYSVCVCVWVGMKGRVGWYESHSFFIATLL